MVCKLMRWFFQVSRGPHLNIEGGVETHVKVPLVVLVEETKETLLENRGRERVGQHNDAIG